MPAKATFQHEGESLQHYGVLGMRWGVRHDKQYKSDKAKITAAYRQDLERAGQKYKRDKNEKALDVAENRAELKRRKAINDAKVKTANRLYSRNSQEANRRIQTRGTAGTLGLSALLGSYGTMHYDRARSEGMGVGRSAVRGALAGYANRLSTAAMPIPGGAAGMHNYLKDRADRDENKRSGTKNRRYMS